MRQSSGLLCWLYSNLRNSRRWRSAASEILCPIWNWKIGKWMQQRFLPSQTCLKCSLSMHTSPTHIALRMCKFRSINTTQAESQLRLCSASTTGRRGTWSWEMLGSSSYALPITCGSWTVFLSTWSRRLPKSRTSREFAETWLTFMSQLGKWAGPTHRFWPG